MLVASQGSSLKAQTSSQLGGTRTQRRAALLHGYDASVNDVVLSPAQIAGVFDALPDAVASNAFESLGPRAMWPLRGVCRRWRRVIEETEWSSFELRTDEEKSAGSAPSSHDAATALREVEAACGLLASIVRSGGGGGGGGGAAPAAAQPREVVFAILGSEDEDEEDGCGEGFLRCFVLGALRALRPPGGAPGRLEGLHLCLKNRVYAQTRGRMDVPLPPGDELRAALSPFGELRSLTRYFQAHDSGATPEAAAAAAAACPLPRSLSFRPDLASESAALAALAPLARLERPAPLFGAARSDLCLAADASGGGFGPIAGGPAGRSLRSLCLLDEELVRSLVGCLPEALGHRRPPLLPPQESGSLRGRRPRAGVPAEAGATGAAGADSEPRAAGDRPPAPSVAPRACAGSPSASRTAASPRARPPGPASPVLYELYGGTSSPSPPAPAPGGPSPSSTRSSGGPSPGPRRGRPPPSPGAPRRLLLSARLEPSAALRPYEILARLCPEVAIKVELACGGAQALP
eukprot:tig00021013_g17080.t2